ncbi:hypothetical protein M8J75_001756 [Diaphorina citri]|nr:hypothetical protein M8J75_001756 [Diaphorina citri]
MVHLRNLRKPFLFRRGFFVIPQVHNSPLRHSTVEQFAVRDHLIKGITADEEYKKNPDLKKEDIQALRQWMLTQPHLPQDVPEETLILIHHSCYFDLEASKSCIEVYFTTRTNTPEFFCKRDINRPELLAQSKVVEFGAIAPKTPQGYQVIFHRLQQFEPSKYVFQDSVRLLAMSIDACLHVEGTVPGYIFLFDMAGVRLGHVLRLSVGQLSKFFLYLQEGLPVRLKGIHILNTRPLIDKIMFVVKPFMKKDLLSLVHFHPEGDISSVYEFVPPKCIPGGDLKGDLPDSKTLHNEYVEWMKNLVEFFLQDEKYQVDESKRVKNKKSAAKQLEKTQVSLQKLELD